MASKRKWKISPEGLQKRLRPLGFRLESANNLCGFQINFSRPSSCDRLYEQLHIQGQGKQGEAVYATTAIAGVRVGTIDPCIAIEDKSLLFALESDQERHWTIIANASQAEAWEERLAALADSYCRQTSEQFGSRLQELLSPLQALVDLYVTRLGDVNSVFDAEWNFVKQSSPAVRRETERLAFEFGSGYGRLPEDVQLAANVLARFVAEIEGGDAYHASKVLQDAKLRGMLHLLTDFIREKRQVYALNLAAD